MSTNDHDDVLAMNACFYAAFDDKDFNAMSTVWSSEAEVTCVHPGWPPIRGHEAVMASWQAIFKGEGDAPTCDAPSCHVNGDGAYVLCRERLGGAVLIATNVFARENGAWVLVHHHASPLARVPATPDLDPEFLPN